ncbi:MAG: AzlC family ABC transporter permease [Chloroflexota bacterium]|nr:AzlC family ABC transporter permease [Anaerolineales bacterium]MCB8966562.1 AzlC family ABC transporter permease [Ardenticatenaceae bacterium]
MTTPRSELLAGIKAELPIALGVMPSGLIYGVLALAAGIPPAVAQAMSAIVFAGSAQLIGVQLIGAGTVTAVLWFTTAIVNLRHMLYSASLAPHVRTLPARWRWLLAYLLTDEAYAMTILHYQDTQTAATHKHWYFLGAGITLWTCWQSSTAVGIFLGAQVPASWSLDFTLALTFLGLITPSLAKRPHLAAAIAAGLVAVLTNAWPYKLGLMAAALTGILIGMWVEVRA